MRSSTVVLRLAACIAFIAAMSGCAATARGEAPYTGYSLAYFGKDVGEVKCSAGSGSALQVLPPPASSTMRKGLAVGMQEAIASLSCQWDTLSGLRRSESIPLREIVPAKVTWDPGIGEVERDEPYAGRPTVRLVFEASRVSVYFDVILHVLGEQLSANTRSSKRVPVSRLIYQSKAAPDAR